MLARETDRDTHTEPKRDSHRDRYSTDKDNKERQILPMMEIEKDTNENVDNNCTLGRMNEKKRLPNYFITSTSYSSN